MLGLLLSALTSSGTAGTASLDPGWEAGATLDPGWEAGATADQRTSGADISRYPMHRMVAVLDDPADARAALDELAGVGVDSSDVVVLTGQEGVAQLDPGGEGHGLLGRLLRVLQLTAEEGNALEFHHQALAAGKSVVYVKANGDARKDAVAAALTAAGGQHLAYFGRWTVEKQP